MVVDSCVWIDYLAGRENPQTARLREALRARAEVVVGDVIRLEVLRGYADEQRARRVTSLLDTLPHVDMLGNRRIDAACGLDRALQRRGRRMSSIDLVIGSFCVAERLPLLTRDAAFAWLGEIAGLQLAVPVG
jgi:predicted nucleic acid-binding protein